MQPVPLNFDLPGKTSFVQYHSPLYPELRPWKKVRSEDIVIRRIPTQWKINLFYYQARRLWNLNQLLYESHCRDSKSQTLPNFAEADFNSPRISLQQTLEVEDGTTYRWLIHHSSVQTCVTKKAFTGANRLEYKSTTGVEQPPRKE